MSAATGCDIIRFATGLHPKRRSTTIYPGHMLTALSSASRPSARASVALLQANAVRAARFLKSMANPARLMVLCQLSTGEKSVGELERVVGISQSGLSQHLAVLRREGIVKTRRVGQTIQYSLAGREPALVIDVLYEVFCSGKATRKPARAPKSKAEA